MEETGLLTFAKEMHRKYKSNVYLNIVVTDKNSTMPKALKHPNEKPCLYENIGGELPSKVLVPQWFAVPNYYDTKVFCGKKD